MADARTLTTLRSLYAGLLRLYPKAFHERFAESMEQTFCDLCRERQADGRAVSGFALGLFAETLAGILRERAAEMMHSRKNVLRLALITACILAVPLVGMQFSDEVDWSIFDFVFAGTFIFGTGLAFLLIAGRTRDGAYRFAVGLALATLFFLIWVNLAVGIIGSEDNPANGLYLGVLVVALLGTFVARLRAREMARALYATALAQALVPVFAFMIWKPPVGDAEAVGEMVQVFLLNALFAVMYIGSGILFSIAGEKKPEASPETP